MPARSTRIRRRGAGPIQPQVLRDLPGCRIDDHSRHQIRAGRETAPVAHPFLFGREQVQPPERGTNHNGDPIRIDPLFHSKKARIRASLASRCHRQVQEPRRQLGDRGIFRVCSRPQPFHHPSQVLKKRRARQLRMPPHSRSSLHQPPPGRIHVPAQTGHRRVPNHKDPFRHPRLPLLTVFANSPIRIRRISQRGRIANFIIFGKAPPSA